MKCRSHQLNAPSCAHHQMESKFLHPQPPGQIHPTPAHQIQLIPAPVVLCPQLRRSPWPQRPSWGERKRGRCLALRQLRGLNDTGYRLSRLAPRLVTMCRRHLLVLREIYTPASLPELLRLRQRRTRQYGQAWRLRCLGRAVQAVAAADVTRLVACHFARVLYGAHACWLISYWPPRLGLILQSVVSSTDPRCPISESTAGLLCPLRNAICYLCCLNQTRMSLSTDRRHVSLEVVHSDYRAMVRKQIHHVVRVALSGFKPKWLLHEKARSSQGKRVEGGGRKNLHQIRSGA